MKKRDLKYFQDYRAKKKREQSEAIAKFEIASAQSIVKINELKKEKKKLEKDNDNKSAFLYLSLFKGSKCMTR
jgi:hypothetical protein